MDFWQIIMTPFSWLLELFCNIFDSYGIALFLFAVVVKIILFPFSLKAKKSMIKMNMVSGQLQAIQKRCGNDRERYNQEVQKFYADNNINPMSGCGWSMIPMFVLFPLYAIIRRPMKYMMGLTEEATLAVANALDWTSRQGSEFVAESGYNELVLVSWLNEGNLSAASAAAGADSLFIINFDLFGIDLSQIPTLKFWSSDVWLAGDQWGAIGLFLLPVLSAVLSWLSSRVSTKTNNMNKEQEQNSAANSTNKTMMIMMPLMSLWIGFTLPAGLCIYWIANSLLMMVQEWLCARILRKDYEAARIAAEEQARKNKEEEKERRRIAAEKKAAAIAANKGKVKKVQPQAKNKGVDLSASREGLRTYARGRAYDPDRYPITPYNDPDAKYKKKEEELTPLTEEEKTILAENGVAIPEETAAPVEDISGETEVQTPSEEAAEDPAGEAAGYEPAYEEEESQE